MTKRDSTKVLWQLKVRQSPKHKWVTKGTFETRVAARYAAWVYRTGGQDVNRTGVGFGNTLVIRHERAQVAEVAK